MRGGRIPYFLRRRALLIPRRGRGRTQFCGQRPRFFQKRFQSLSIPRRGRGRTQFCGQRPHFFQKRFQALNISRHGRGTREPAFQAGDGRPHHLFFRKRDGAAWRYQRKIVGAKQLVVLPEAEMRPDTPLSSQEAPSPSQNPPSKKKGFTGEHGSPVKSRAARDAVPHCISAEMPRLSPWRFLSWTAPAARSLFAAKREWGAVKHFPLGKKRLRPAGAKKRPGRFAANKFRSPDETMAQCALSPPPFSDILKKPRFFQKN